MEHKRLARVRKWLDRHPNIQFTVYLSIIVGAVGVIGYLIDTFQIVRFVAEYAFVALMIRCVNATGASANKWCQERYHEDYGANFYTMANLVGWVLLALYVMWGSDTFHKPRLAGACILLLFSFVYGFFDAKLNPEH